MLNTRARQLGFILGLLTSSACAIKHSPPALASYRIEGSGASLSLRPPSSSGVAATPILFSQLIVKQYGFNPWEEYVDLSPGMRLAVQRMTTQPQTINSYFEVVAGGRRGSRIHSLADTQDAFDTRAKYLRFFYQIKFTQLPGQPQRPALFLWSNTPDQLAGRTTQAKQNPDFPCGAPSADCVSFPGKTTVSPEVEIIVNQKPRYVLLSSTVRDVLRTDRVRDDTEIRLRRRYRNRLVPVTWEQRASLLPLPLVAGDEISW